MKPHICEIGVSGAIAGNMNRSGAIMVSIKWLAGVNPIIAGFQFCPRSSLSSRTASRHDCSVRPSNVETKNQSFDIEPTVRLAKLRRASRLRITSLTRPAAFRVSAVLLSTSRPVQKNESAPNNAMERTRMLVTPAASSLRSEPAIAPSTRVAHLGR